MVRFSANLGFLWQDRDLLARIDAAAAAGFRAIELHWPYATDATAVKARYESLGLKLLGLNTPLGNQSGDFGLAAVAGREAEFEAGFQQALRYAEVAGASAIHVMAGVTTGHDHKACAGALRRNLTLAAQSTDLTILLEPLNPRDKPGYFYSTLAPAAAAIADVALPNIKLMFDVYHVAISEGDVSMKLAHYLPLIGHIQIAAVPSRAEPDEGEICYAEILRRIDSLGYTGWVGAEYKPRGGTGAGLGWMKTLTGREH